MRVWRFRYHDPVEVQPVLDGMPPIVTPVVEITVMEETEEAARKVADREYELYQKGLRR